MSVHPKACECLPCAEARRLNSLPPADQYGDPNTFQPSEDSYASLALADPSYDMEREILFEMAEASGRGW